MDPTYQSQQLNSPWKLVLMVEFMENMENFQKPINIEQFALMVEFMENNGSGELRCERPKMKWFIM